MLRILRIIRGDNPMDALYVHRDYSGSAEVLLWQGSDLVNLLPSNYASLGIGDKVVPNKAFPVLGAPQMLLRLWGVHSTPTTNPSGLTCSVTIVHFPLRVNKNLITWPQGRRGLGLDFIIGAAGLISASNTHPILGTPLTSTDVRSAHSIVVNNGTADPAKRSTYQIFSGDATAGDAAIIFDTLGAAWIHVYLTTKGASFSRALIGLQRLYG